MNSTQHNSARYLERGGKPLPHRRKPLRGLGKTPQAAWGSVNVHGGTYWHLSTPADPLPARKFAGQPPSFAPAVRLAQLRNVREGGVGVARLRRIPATPLRTRPTAAQSSPAAHNIKGPGPRIGGPTSAVWAGSNLLPVAELFGVNIPEVDLRRFKRGRLRSLMRPTGGRPILEG